MLSAIRTFLIRAAIIMSQLTRPGSFFHELAHQLACYAAGHKVLEVRYIIRNDPNSVVGYVRRRGPPGMGRELFIGIAPLLLGLAIWAGYIGVAIYLTRDDSLGLVDTLILVVATLLTANATYHALPSPQDMEMCSGSHSPCFRCLATSSRDLCGWSATTAAGSSGDGPRGTRWSSSAPSTLSTAWWRPTCCRFCPICPVLCDEKREAARKADGLSLDFHATKL